MKTTKEEVTRFVTSYIETALWASTDDDGNSLDDRYYTEDIDNEFVAHQECVRFIWENRVDLRTSCLSAERAGHDFFLNRNRHGAGFWDEGLRALGTRLSNASKLAGETTLDLGDDGKLYFI